jgi:4-diphosphocytidyl-2-C-methyl-D-erythritol kinase
MDIHHFTPSQRIRIDSPAKLNLVLEVLHRRSDGFHEISSVFCPIGLWDCLQISNLESEEIRFELELPEYADPSESAWSIPSDSTNLVVRAVELVREELGIARGCQIRLRKSIPALAGLGGGSGDAAAAVTGCLLLWSRWNRHLARRLCDQLGSDTNFFLGSENGFGLMQVEGRGERTDLIDCRPSLAFWVTRPPLGCSTAEVYGKLSEIGSKQKVLEFRNACQTGLTSKIGAALFNALQLPATSVNPWIGIQLDLLAECGCVNVMVTGSGSCCFGLVPENGSFEQLRRKANQVGVVQVYEVEAWYGDSIERQIQELSAG